MKKPILHVIIKKECLKPSNEKTLHTALNRIKSTFSEYYDIIVTPVGVDILADNTTVVNITINEDSNIKDIADQLFSINRTINSHIHVIEEPEEIYQDEEYFNDCNYYEMNFHHTKISTLEPERNVYDATAGITKTEKDEKAYVEITNKTGDISMVCNDDNENVKIYLENSAAIQGFIHSLEFIIDILKHRKY